MILLYIICAQTIDDAHILDHYMGPEAQLVRDKTTNLIVARS